MYLCCNKYVFMYEIYILIYSKIYSNMNMNILIMKIWFTYYLPSPIESYFHLIKNREIVW